MAYRDELQAAHDRAAALEREKEDLRDKLALAIAEQPRALVTKPGKFTVDTRGDQLRITWRAPRTHLAAVLLRFLIIAGACVVAYIPPVGSAFYALLAVAVLWLCFDLARLSPRVTLTAGDDGLTKSLGPLPWEPRLRMAREHIVQLFVERRGEELALCAVDHRGQKKTIIDGLTDPAHARWLENTLERHLDIPAQPVAGELGP